MSTETLEKSTIVRIMANGERYRKAPVFIVPFFDEKKKQFVVNGTIYAAKQAQDDKALWETTTPEGVYISTYDFYEIGDKLTLNLSEPIDKFIYDLILDTGSKMIAKSKKDANPKYHRLYIENRELEAEEEITQLDSIFKAAELVMAMKSTELRDLARVLKINEATSSDKVVLSNIIKMIKTRPTFVLNILNSPSYKSESIRSLLVAGNVIVKSAKGYYTNTEANSAVAPEFLAYTDADMGSYILNKKNSKQIEQWVIEAKKNLAESHD